MSEPPELTPKAQQTRQHILETALKLFADNGYEKTTMRDIATEAGCSLGLAYRYFASKDDFVMALYWQFHYEWAEEFAQIEGGTLAERFDSTMRIKVRQLTPYREAVGSLFTTMMNPTSAVGVLSTNTAELTETVMAVFEDVVRGASDAPKEARIEHITLLLYSAHLLIQLFWLYDRTPGQKATLDLLDFTRDSLRFLRPVLRIPFFGNSIARLATILAQVFGAQR